MFAEITLSNGRLVSPFASFALYSSERTASSPLTAYFASLTWGFMLLIFKLRREEVVDIVRCGLCKGFVEDGNECRGLSKCTLCQIYSVINHSKVVRHKKAAAKKKLSEKTAHRMAPPRYMREDVYDPRLADTGSRLGSLGPVKYLRWTYLKIVMTIIPKSNMTWSGKRAIYERREQSGGCLLQVMTH